MRCRRRFRSRERTTGGRHASPFLSARRSRKASNSRSVSCPRSCSGPSWPFCPRSTPSIGRRPEAAAAAARAGSVPAIRAAARAAVTVVRVAPHAPQAADRQSRVKTRPAPAGAGRASRGTRVGGGIMRPMTTPRCPICAGETHEIRAKLVCRQCGAILETCCEGGPMGGGCDREPAPPAPSAPPDDPRRG